MPCPPKRRSRVFSPLSYRAALIGLAAGLLFLIGFAMALGLAARLALLFFGLYFLVVIT
jgi:hypothetical protein